MGEPLEVLAEVRQFLREIRPVIEAADWAIKFYQQDDIVVGRMVDGEFQPIDDHPAAAAKRHAELIASIRNGTYPIRPIKISQLRVDSNWPHPQMIVTGKRR